MNTLYYALGKRKGSLDPPKIITWGGSNYYATKEQLSIMITQMSQVFPYIEYSLLEGDLNG